MRYSVDPLLFRLFPGFIRKVLIGEGVHNLPENPTLDIEFRSALRAVAADSEIEVGHPRIAAWQQVYQSFPTAGRIRPSIHTLVRRARNPSGKPIPFVSTLVCVSNLISLTHLVPSGLIDGHKVSGNIGLGIARGGELFTPIGSADEEMVLPGEVIYYDIETRDVLCRGWNSRGGQVAATDASTRRVIIDIDALLPLIDRDELDRAAETLTALVRQHCGGILRAFELSPESPAFEYEWEDYRANEPLR